MPLETCSLSERRIRMLFTIPTLNRTYLSCILYPPVSNSVTSCSIHGMDHARTEAPRHRCGPREPIDSLLSHTLLGGLLRDRLSHVVLFWNQLSTARACTRLHRSPAARRHTSPWGALFRRGPPQSAAFVRTRCRRSRHRPLPRACFASSSSPSSSSLSPRTCWEGATPPAPSRRTRVAPSPRS